MNVALLADIHANLSAFEAVLNDMAKYSPNAIVIAGDSLGYYCGAEEVIQKILSLDLPYHLVYGNHDVHIIRGSIPNGLVYGHILQLNLDQLSCNSIAFLKTLKAETNFVIDSIKIHVYHGTPDDPLNGRLYPDAEPNPSWFNIDTNVIVLGNTHYPFLWRGYGSTIIINPGSVGQPRDGNPAPSWALLNTQTMEVSFKRIDYDRELYSEKLRNQNWDKRAINALFKTKKGTLNVW